MISWNCLKLIVCDLIQAVYLVYRKQQIAQVFSRDRAGTDPGEGERGELCAIRDGRLKPYPRSVYPPLPPGSGRDRRNGTPEECQRLQRLLFALGRGTDSRGTSDSASEEPRKRPVRREGLGEEEEAAGRNKTERKVIFCFIKTGLALPLRHSCCSEIGYDPEN